MVGAGLLPVMLVAMAQANSYYQTNKQEETHRG
jgi:hypothetical protein